jgi:hypothetical protein
MKDCWSWWQNARQAPTEAQRTAAIQWLQTTAAEELFAVGINSFPPMLRIKAPNVHNVSFDRRVVLQSAVYLDDR